MQTVVLAIQIISCVVLIVVVLMQAGKEGMGVIFGGGSGSVFGSSGAGGLLVRITVVAAIVFLGSTVFYNALIAKPLKEESVTVSLESGEVQKHVDPGVLIEDPGVIPETPVVNATVAPADNATVVPVVNASQAAPAAPAPAVSEPAAAESAPAQQNSSTSGPESNKTN